MYTYQQLSEYLYTLKSTALTTFLFFGLPLGVLIIGIWIIYRQWKRKRSVALPIIAAVAAEAAALIPLIGVTFFSKDGVIYLVGIAVNVIYMLIVLSPLTILMIWVAIYRALKRNGIRISRSFYVVSALVEVVSLAVSVYITIKDITTPQLVLQAARHGAIL